MALMEPRSLVSAQHSCGQAPGHLLTCIASLRDLGTLCVGHAGLAFPHGVPFLPLHLLQRQTLTLCWTCTSRLFSTALLLLLTAQDGWGQGNLRGKAASACC